MHQRLSLFLTLMALAAIVACLPSATAMAARSTIPPVILQGCAQKVKPARFHLFGNSADAVGAHAVGFDVSFINTTSKDAVLVMLRIGKTEFAKTGKFSPGVVIAWRLAAEPGDCSIRAVRFADGSEWDAPQDE